MKHIEPIAWLLALGMVLGLVLLYQWADHVHTEKLLKQGYQQEIGGWQRGGAR